MTADLQRATALVVRPKERRYYEVSTDDDVRDDFMEVFGLMVAHPHVLLLVSASASSKQAPLEYLGEATVDGHPCVKFGAAGMSGFERMTFYAASDLKNLVVRIEWASAYYGNIVVPFPPEGVTFLRNARLGAARELFEVPSGFTRADRARERAEKTAPPPN